MAAATVGGTASAIGGGKFANGAWTAAFVSRFNHDGRPRFRFQESIDAIENMAVSDRQKAKLFGDLHEAAAQEFRRIETMTPLERAEFFGLSVRNPLASVRQLELMADIQKLMVYSGARYSGQLAREVYAISGIVPTALQSSRSIVAQGAGAALQMFNLWSMFRGSGYSVSFHCIGGATVDCYTEVSR